MPGTGFFVAPGRVLTCVHVVGTSGAPIAVRLADGRAVRCGAPPVVYCDRGRPIPELAGDYPDLALLDVDAGAHPCVGVDPDWPRLDDAFQAYGFPSEGGSVVLTPVRLSYSGKKGPEDRAFIDLGSTTPVTPGMSGAPLFSVRTAAVCGVLVATRSPSQAHGGLAVAWSALGPATDELLASNERFHTQDERWGQARRQRRRHIVVGRVHTVAHFTGRSVELDKLAAHLQAEDRAVITQAITGLGGVGKTQLAARYVQRYGSDYDVVAWVRVEDGGTADLAMLAATLGLNVSSLTAQERADQALRWLERCDERWLLVLDNVNGPEQLESCCPAGGNGRVLITSRNRDLEQIAPTMSIDVFDQATAIEYLLSRTGRTSEHEEARTLARALGGLPLALSHAGAYCAKATSFAEYLTLLDDLPPSALYDRSPEAFYRQTVASTWQPSIRAASKEAPVAPHVLAMAAHLAPDDIPRALFDALIDDTKAHQRKQLADAIAALDRYSLATIERETLSVHRLLQRVIRDTTAASELLDAAGRAALRALTEAMPTDPQQPQYWPLYEHLLTHILALTETLDQPADIAPQLIELLNHGCVYLLHAGTFQRAMETTILTARYATDLLGAKHPDTLTARANLASSYWQAGRTSDAIELLEQVLADRERLLGPEHPDTLTTRANLAHSYAQAGRTSDAITIEEQVLADRERLLGPEHPDTLTTRANLANSYAQAGRTSDAIALQEQVLADCERLLGPEHPNTLATRANLASSYWQAGRTSDAIALQEQVLRDRERLLGPEHPSTLTARANLAASYAQAGRTSDAITIKEQVLADCERLLGPEHPDTLTMRANLAHSYRQAGRISDAIELLEQVLADRERLLGPEHPNTLTARAVLREWTADGSAR
ncbi:MAG: tetratricopeptide repeat protein [Solirubrobacteraceae bacterium]